MGMMLTAARAVAVKGLKAARTRRRVTRGTWNTRRSRRGRVAPWEGRGAT